MSTEAVATSEIEGEILDRASVQSSIRGQLGLTTDRRRIAPAEDGISEMMVDLYRTFEEPLSEAMVFQWRRMLFAQRGGLRDIWPPSDGRGANGDPAGSRARSASTF